MAESGASNSPFSGRGSSTESSQGSGSTRKSRIIDGDQSSGSSLESFLGHLSHVPTLNGVTFFLNKLPLTTERDNEFVDPSLVYPTHPHYVHYLAKTYFPPLNTISYSEFACTHKCVFGIYVHFGPKGCYKLHWRHFPGEANFEAALETLFQTGDYTVRGDVEWYRIETFGDMMSNMSMYGHVAMIVGCLNGIQGPDNAQHYQVLIEESPVESQHTMIVVGQTLKGKISNRIHRYATVPAAEPAECLAQVIFALEAKFFLDTDSIFFCEKN